MIEYGLKELRRKHIEVTNGWDRGGSLRGRGLSGFEWSVHVFSRCCKKQMEYLAIYYTISESSHIIRGEL